MHMPDVEFTHISLTLTGIATLFGSMVVLALVPGISVLTVTARSAACGFLHGAFTAAGIVTGDIVFIIIAVLGLSVLADVLGDLFVLVKYLGGAYLIWLGIKLWRTAPHKEIADTKAQDSLLSSFLSGLFITLGDQKAILFYLGFFPAFLDLTSITLIDTIIIISIATVAVGGVKLAYAFTASRMRLYTEARSYRVINITAGSVLLAVGLFLITKS
jgi:threonine/homoserine/homoserine lactone efflux protein